MVSTASCKRGKDHGTCFMNINCCYEFWSDVPVPVLHTLDRRHPALYLPFVCLVAITLDLGPYCLLQWLSAPAPAPITAAAAARV